MFEKSIENIINEELSFEDKIAAFDFVSFLRENELIFVRDRGYWKDKIYFVVKYNNDCVCFISIKDPDEPENRWTVWSDDMDSAYLTDHAVDNELKKQHGSMLIYVVIVVRAVAEGTNLFLEKSSIGFAGVLFDSTTLAGTIWCL